MQYVYIGWAVAFILVMALCVAGCVAQLGQHDQELEMPHWLDRHIRAATPASGPKFKPVPQWRLAVRQGWYAFRRYIGEWWPIYTYIGGVLALVAVSGLLGALLAARG